MLKRTPELKIDILIQCFLIFLFPVSITAFSEKDALIMALSRNTDILLIRSQAQIDSLSLKAIESGWLPQVTLSASPSYSFFDTSRTKIPVIDTVGGRNDTTGFIYQGKDDTRSELSGSAGISQPLPGGGDISAGISQSITYPGGSDPGTYGSSYSFGFTQPLLKNAFRFGSPEYSIKLAHIDNRIVSLQRRKQLLSQLSSMRTLFWSYFEKQSLLTIAENEAIRAEEQLKTERTRIRVGESAPIDTLNAALQYMRTRQSLLNAQIDLDASRNDLSVALMINPDSIGTPDSATIDLPDLPDPSTFASLVGEYDPQLKIFEKLGQKVYLQLEKNRNALMPALDFSLSTAGSRSGDALFTDKQLGRNAVVSLILSYALPLNQQKINVKKTQLDMERNDINALQYRKNLDKQLRELRRTWEQEKYRISLAGASVELSEKQLSAAQRGYELGTVDRLTLLSARDDLTSAQNSLVRAKIGMKRLEIIIDELMGTLFQRFGINAE